MLGKHSTCARGALLATLAAVAAVACSSSDDASTDDALSDAAPPAIVGDSGVTNSAPDGGTLRGDGGTTTTSANDSGSTTTTQPHAGCGLTLKGSHWNLSCQSWMNANCCDEQLACANDSDCKALVDCIGACKPNNTDACVATCEQNNPAGQSLLNTMGACSKAAPSDGGAAIPTKCSWP